MKRGLVSDFELVTALVMGMAYGSQVVPFITGVVTGKALHITEEHRKNGKDLTEKEFEDLVTQIKKEYTGSE